MFSASDIAILADPKAVEYYIAWKAWPSQPRYAGAPAAHSFERPQEDLAKKLFVTKATVSGWEKGIHHPDLSMICKLAEVFGVSVEVILGGKLSIKVSEE